MCRGRGGGSGSDGPNWRFRAASRPSPIACDGGHLCDGLGRRKPCLFRSEPCPTPTSFS